MAKIGTAHVEIKPVLADGALDEIMKRVEDAVAEGVRRGMARAHSPAPDKLTDRFAEAVRRLAEGNNGGA